MSKKIVIDSGHGGEDNGASGNGIVEKDLTLKISKYMKQRFDELGIPNQMTRTEDVTLNPTDRVNKVLSFYGDGKDVIVLSNHINAGGDEFTYHYIIWLGIRTSIFELVIFMIKYTKIVILYVIMV